MDLVERIMRAFVRRRPLTSEQEAMVRAEVTEFAQALLSDHKEAIAKTQTSIDRRPAAEAPVSS
jgi:hypothetical protein